MYGCIEKTASLILSRFEGFAALVFEGAFFAAGFTFASGLLVFNFFGPALTGITFLGLADFDLTAALACFLAGFLSAFFFEVDFLGMINNGYKNIFKTWAVFLNAVVYFPGKFKRKIISQRYNFIHFCLKVKRN
jgi:hypothetical protein